MEDLKAAVDKLPSSDNRLRLARQVKDEQGNKKGVEGTGPKHVTLGETKVVRGTDYRGNEEIQVKLFVEHDGEQKYYVFPLKDGEGNAHYLAEALAEYNEGDQVVMEYKKKETGVGGFIEVRPDVSQSMPSVEDEKALGGEDDINEADIPDVENI